MNTMRLQQSKTIPFFYFPLVRAQTSSGLDLPAVELVRSDGDQHSYSYGQSHDKVECVKAY